MSYVRQDAKDKIKALEEIVAEAGVTAADCAYIGDDLADMPVMRQVSLAVAVADAAEDTKQVAHYVTACRGGHGAVREVIDLILKAQGRWDELMRWFD